MIVNQKAVWPAVVALLGAMMVVAAMAIAGVSVTVISVTVIPLAMLLLTALTAQISATLQGVKEQTNGQQAVLTAMVERMANMLAAANVPAGALPPNGSTVSTPADPPVSTVDTPAVDKPVDNAAVPAPPTTASTVDSHP